MAQHYISYQDSGYVSNLISDYLNNDIKVQNLYLNYPSKDGFKNQIDQKRESYPLGFRSVLGQVLKSQNKFLSLSDKTKTNINKIEDSSTYTVTTGHQLSLFTGPLYFIYKIISTIRLAEDLTIQYPECNFVPIYWMATEDHDFEEISFFRVNEKTIRWKQEQKGAVGKIKTNSLDVVLDELDVILGTSRNANYLKELFKKAYLDNENLADATRYLVNELFGNKGLVIIDGDDHDLKQLFSPVIKEELRNQVAFNEVSDTLRSFPYKVQVNPREINLFYLGNGYRERIVWDGFLFKVNNTEIEFSKEEVLSLVDSNPELFSPNVIMRPLYQEMILPNLAYIGGGGEIAYWLELKHYFDTFKVTFPMLIIRDSALIISAKQRNKIKLLDVDLHLLFQKREDLKTSLVKKLSDVSIDFSPLKDVLRSQFDEINKLIKITDASFEGAVNAQEKKQLNGLDQLEKRFMRAQKIKYSEQMDRVISLQNQLFPNDGLQERQVNFSEFYLEYGLDLIEQLFDQFDCLTTNYKIIAM